MREEKDCLFCGIIDGKIPARVAFQDDRVVAFHDINPQAPHHILVCPRRHIPTLNDLGSGDESLMGHVVCVASGLAAKLGIADEGYRLVMNCQEGAGQSVFHIHAHVLGGRVFGWPPG
jgi:histidine triad (HIT) family protein